MPLKRTFASRVANGDDFGRFQCWDGDPATPWIAEVQDDIRGGWIFKQEYVLAFRDEDEELVAVTAFVRRQLQVSRVDPTEHPGWHLHCVAVRLDLQRAGIGNEVVTATLACMQEIDAARAIFTVRVHEENDASVALCTKYRLVPFARDVPYLDLLGDVQP